MTRSMLQVYSDQSAAYSRRLSDSEERRASKVTLIKAHLDFAYNRALIFHKQYSSIPLVDFIAQGNLGLFHAARKFNKSMGRRFITYAHHHVNKQMRRIVIERFARANKHGVKISSMHDIIRDYGSRDCGRTFEEITMRENNSDLTPAAIMMRKDDIEFMKTLVADLGDMEKKYIQLRFHDRMKRNEISKLMSINAPNLGTLEERVLKSLRQRLAGVF